MEILAYKLACSNDKHSIIIIEQFGRACSFLCCLLP